MADTLSAISFAFGSVDGGSRGLQASHDALRASCDARIPPWSRYLGTVLEFAKVKDAHSHRFRDTFAVSLLENGVSIENVSVLLGHSSVRITERHYKPWVKTLEKRLDDEVRKAWA